MFEATSRYAEIENATLEKENNHPVLYKKRRFLPLSDKMTVIQEVQVAAGDRLDNIAASFTGDPEQFWRICDANDAMHPLDLTAEPGKILKITLVSR
jgi:hypothetical protein